MVEKQNDEARRAARRLEKERKRLEMGSDYESSGNEHDDYYSDEVRSLRSTKFSIVYRV